jgi:hydroxyacyl-ACP dehydratase HTD2-like protein with hotdog domain
VTVSAQPIANTATYQVTRDSIRKFALATSVTDAIHHDVAAARSQGYRDIVAPSYFFVSLGLSLDQVRPRAELSPGGMSLDDPLADRRVVAGETSVDWYGEIVAGDEITVTQRFLGMSAKEGRTGALEVHRFERDYHRGPDLLVRERYSRIAR